jgi:hypothetical protein
MSRTAFSADSFLAMDSSSSRSLEPSLGLSSPIRPNLADGLQVAERAHFSVECRAPVEHGAQGGENGPNAGDRARISLAQIPEILNDYGRDQVLERHTGPMESRSTL